MLDEAKRQGRFGKGRPKEADKCADSEHLTLDELGIDRKLSARAQRVGGIAEQAFEAMVARTRQRIADGAGKVNFDLSTEDKKQRRSDREKILGGIQHALPDKKYGVIYADPAWRFGPYSRETGMNRSPDNHYPTMTLGDIMRLQVDGIAAKDCALFLWSTGAMLIEALYVAEAWGFLDLGDRADRAALMTRDDIDWSRYQLGDPNARYKSQQVWQKIYAGNGMGTGYWFRNEHETLLLFTRGKIPAPAPGTQFRSVIEESVGRHSAKPDKFYEIIEQYFPNLPKIELNARRARPGWDAWGNEAPENAQGELIKHDKTTGEVIAA